MFFGWSRREISSAWAAALSPAELKLWAGFESAETHNTPPITLTAQTVTQHRAEGRESQSAAPAHSEMSSKLSFQLNCNFKKMQLKKN